MNNVPLSTVFLIELKKTKRTLAFWGAVGSPLFVIFVNFMIYFARPEQLNSAKADLWISITRNALNIWTLIFLNLYLTVLTFLVSNIEHKSKGWKHIFVLPVERWKYYLSKFFVVVVFLFISNSAFYILNFVSISLLSQIYPAAGFTKSSPHIFLAVILLKVTFAGIGAAGILLLISVFVKNFIVPIGFGILCTVANIMLMRWEKIIYSPFAYPYFSGNGIIKGNSNFFELSTNLSLLIGAITVLAGIFLINRVTIRE